MSTYVVTWGDRAYVTKRSSNRKPYTDDPRDPDVKSWKSSRAAERRLSLKDKCWAAECRLEEVSDE